jgi:hypothetical protein
MCLELDTRALGETSRRTQTAWTASSDKLLKTRSLSFACEWAFAVFQQRNITLELPSHKVYQALDSLTDARWSLESFLQRVSLLDWMCLDPGPRSRHMRLLLLLCSIKAPRTLVAVVHCSNTATQNATCKTLAKLTSDGGRASGCHTPTGVALNHSRRLRRHVDCGELRRMPVTSEGRM